MVSGTAPQQSADSEAAARAQAAFHAVKSRSPASRFWRQGEPFVWASGAAVALTLTLTFTLLLIVLVNGLGFFWPASVALVELSDGTQLLGERIEAEVNPDTHTRHVKYKVGNAEYREPTFRWVEEEEIRAVSHPPEAFVLHRMEHMNYYGFLESLSTPGLDLPADGTATERLWAAMRAARRWHAEQLAPLIAQQQAVARRLKDHVKYAILKAEYQRQRKRDEGVASEDAALAALDHCLQQLRAQEKELNEESERLTEEIALRLVELRKNVAIFRDAAGRTQPIVLVDIVRAYQPNAMRLWEKAAHYMSRVWEILTTDPREANQDGGLFPAIFGTVLLVFLMAIFCFPLGVLAGIYLGEYARDGLLVRLVRVAVNNLAGIPSIVYGIFGLGFFIYLIGGNLDRWLYPECVAAAEPVFGQGCLLWASLTLGLLTIPVVIVSTEESLRAIPRGISEGSYALGATKLQTLFRLLLPMASPGIMTGFILAMARAAGEVAPLMFTGALKSAPVPLDSSFPYLHLDRQFMHLGYHILDISCKSPNVEATKPLVYVTTMVLLLVVVVATASAIYVRNRMQKRFALRAI